MNEKLINRLRDVPDWIIGSEIEETMLDAACALEAIEVYERAWTQKRERLEKHIAELEAKLDEAENSIKNYKDLYLSRKREELLLAQRIPKEGEWIDEPVYKKTMDGKTWDGYTYCSVCKEMHKYGYRSDFCSNCGARMKHNDSNVLGALEGKEQVENILYGYDNIDDDEYEDDLDWEEPADLEMGYDPYLGCYTDDC